MFRKTKIKALIAMAAIDLAVVALAATVICCVCKPKPTMGEQMTDKIKKAFKEIGKKTHV